MITWSRQLTRAAGNIDVRGRVIKLSMPLLLESYRTDGLFTPEFEVCGLKCETPEAALREILKHEMIHLWLHELGKPCGHTAEFRAKAKEVGQPRTRHGIALPRASAGWVYVCSHCGQQILRQRRMARLAACGICCKKHNRGKFHERFLMRGARLKSG